MTIEAARDGLSATPAPNAAHPVSFDGLFGWYSPGLARSGVILCGTLGFEQLSAYRAWRALAEEIAGAGCPCLRFDYPGEGDSGDAEGGRVAGFVAAIRHAIRYMRSEAGVDRIVLVGLRLGANLAALAARGGDVDRLVLLAPYETGRAYLREMQMQARTTIIWPGGLPLQPEPGTVNAHGFILRPALIDDLARLDAAAFREIGAKRVLIVERSPSKVAALVAQSGAELTCDRFERFADLLSGTMNFRTVREVVAASAGLIASVTRFAVDGAGTGPAKPILVPPGACLSEPDWREDAVPFGDDLFGILCRPREGPADGRTVLIVNSGTYVRSGAGRSATHLARTLAAHGTSSFRMDLRGMGDSPDRPRGGAPVYTLDALDDVTAAIDRLHRLGASRILIVGICSGAYLAFHAICRDERIDDAVAVNLYCFDWPQDACLETALARPTVRSASTYARSLLTGNTWRRLLTGRISVPLILRGILRTWPNLLLRHWASRRGCALARSRTIDRVAGIRRRGGRIVFAYSADDPGSLNIQSELGLSLPQIGSRLQCPFEIIDRCDHNLSTPESQAHLRKIVLDVIDRRRSEDREARQDVATARPAYPAAPDAGALVLSAGTALKT